MADTLSQSCSWCDKATFTTIRGPGGEQRAVCADHYIGLQSVENERQRLLSEQTRHAMAMMNLAAEEMNAVAGFSLGPTIDIPAPAAASNFNSINVTNSTIGVVSTAAVGEITAYVGHMDRNDTARIALEKLTTAVVSDPTLSEPDRAALLEQIAHIADQAARPPERRKPALVTPVLEAISKGANAVTSLATLWTALEPILKQHFGI